MTNIYTEGFEMLRVYPEFEAVFQLGRRMILGVAGLLVVVALLHVTYLLGYNSPLYRRRSPRPGWNKRLLPALIVFFCGLVGLYVATGWLIA